MENLQILLRFDDICPTMNWRQWEYAYQQMKNRGVTALLGVIPDCQDPDLNVDNPRTDFWEYIKMLQEQGFTIAMHGYRHVFEVNHSEFAGLPYDVQFDKIKRGKKIMLEHGIETAVFFAPAHNYDDNTLRALSACGFKYMSDGLSRKPYKRHGIILLPCRSGGIPQIKSRGSYTAVVHAHEWEREKKKYDKQAFINLLANHSEHIVSFDKMKSLQLGNPFFQRCDERFYQIYRHSIKPILSKAKRLVFR